MLKRRTLHECVDWNASSITSRHIRHCRTLHECVDWNALISRTSWPPTLSHSTRVRGLKCLRFLTRRTSGSVALYTSAWIEILFRGYVWLSASVALYTSAWIEIINGSKASRGLSRRTLHECVDWNSRRTRCKSAGQRVALYTSAWIEM